MNKKHLAVFLTVVVVVLVGAAAVFMYHSSNKQTPVANANSNVNQPVVTVNDNANVVVTNANTTVTNHNTNTVVNTNSTTNTNSSITTATSLDPSGTIQWSGPTKISSLKIFTTTNTGGLNRETGQYGPSPSDVANPAQYYSVGKFLSGQYKDGEIIIASAYPEGPAFSADHYYIVRRNGKLTLLQKHSPPLGENDGVQKQGLEVDATYTISSLVYPSTLKVQTPKATLLGKEYQKKAFFSSEHVVKAFTDPVLGDAYITKFDGSVKSTEIMDLHSVYFRGPDGTVHQYDVEVAFVNDELIPNVTWNDGKKNTAVYTYTDVNGCGSTNSFSVVTPDVATVANDMIAIGKTSTGDTVYGLKNSNHALLKDMYENDYYIADGEKKVPYATFVASRPMFFWVEPFGRVVRFTSAAYRPLAECGKPVIYLYPQQTTDVTVTLKPAGGFTYTEPVYTQGWKVRATPTGNLTELLTGKQYPYLFWEGRGGMYQTPEQGFVVAQAEVHTFLQDKLTDLGLNTQERADFVEFWEPRMQSAPYYFVTFMGNEVMDQLAPLTVSPKPDTIIRILMDYLPLQQPKAVQGYTIRTPERKGFTVVEWGGVLRDE